MEEEQLQPGVEKAQEPGGKSLPLRIARRVLFFVPLFYNPIFVKEMRGAFRRRRFFMAHTLCLAIVSLAIMLGAFTGSSQDEAVEPDKVGKELFNLFVMVQFFIVFMVFPAFGCTSITEERVNKSFDLLVTTNLRAWEIVLGKFLSTLVYSGIFLVSTVPLVCMSFLYGGVTVSLILQTYLVLLFFCVFTIAFSILISSIATTSTKAVISTYAFLLLTGAVMYFAADWVVTNVLLTPAEAVKDNEDFLMRLQRAVLETRLDEANQAFLLAYVVLFFAGLFSVFFIVASNKLKPVSFNRSTNLRILYVVFAVIALSVVCSHFMYNAEATAKVMTAQKNAEKNDRDSGSTPAVTDGDNSSAESSQTEKDEPAYALRPKMTLDEKVAVAMKIYGFTALYLLLGTILFAGESPARSLRIRNILSERYRGLRRALRLFAPGSSSGAGFILAFSIVVFAALTLFFLNFGDVGGMDWPVSGHYEASEMNPLDGSTVSTYRGWYSLFYFPAMAWTFLYFVAVFGAWATRRGFNPLATRVLLVVIAALVPLLPLIAYVFSAPSKIYSFYYISPLIGYLDSWLLPESRWQAGHATRLFVAGVPLHFAVTLFYSILGTLFLVLLSRGKKRRKKA